jgi:hypothetical protein
MMDSSPTKFHAENKENSILKTKKIHVENKGNSTLKTKRIPC